jgi:CRISPR system Cascade subunit CasA
MPRRIRLNFCENRMGQSCDLLGLTDGVAVETYVTRPYGINYMGWRHPLSPYYKQNEHSSEYLPLHFKSSAVGYKHWIGLALRSRDEARVSSNNVFNFIRKRAPNLGIESGDPKQEIGILACGYAMDNMKPLDFTEAMLPVIITGDADRDMELADCAKAMVEASDLAVSQLLTALKIALFSEAKIDNGKTPLDAPRQRFWAETEAGFYRLLRHAAGVSEGAGAVFDKAKADWLPIISKAALRIFDETAPVDSPEDPDIEQIVKGRRFLFFALQGYGGAGAKLFRALGMEPPQNRKSKGKAV